MEKGRMVRCPNCENETLDLQKWQLDRVLKTQVALVANKIKYSKTAYEKKYARTERWIRETDPEFYKEVKVS